MNLETITHNMVEELDNLTFHSPVEYVYNPLKYAGDNYREYLNRYGDPPKKAVMLGMNPGPWGMAQTGVPFGEVNFIKNWLKIVNTVGKPQREHEKRPVTGLKCHRSEKSGLRLWNWAKARYGSPEKFFHLFFIANYCPLAFFDQDGRNLTPDKLRKKQREPLFRVCDEALRRTIEYLDAECLIGIGKFAYERAEEALSGFKIKMSRVMHPSPANPQANKGWGKFMDKEVKKAGL